MVYLYVLDAENHSHCENAALDFSIRWIPHPLEADDRGQQHHMD